MLPATRAAAPTHMVPFRVGFDHLGLKAQRNVAVATNILWPSISGRFGFEPVNFELDGRVIGGKPMDVVHFVLEAEKAVGIWAWLTRSTSGPESCVREWQEAHLHAMAVRSSAYPDADFVEDASC